MSVRTTADEKLDSAASSVKSAIKDLQDIIVDECYGHDEYSVQYIDKVEQCLSDLISIKRKLNR